MLCIPNFNSISPVVPTLVDDASLFEIFILTSSTALARLVSASSRPPVKSLSGQSSPPMHPGSLFAGRIWSVRCTIGLFRRSNCTSQASPTTTDKDKEPADARKKEIVDPPPSFTRLQVSGVGYPSSAARNFSPGSRLAHPCFTGSHHWRYIAASGSESSKRSR